MKKWLLIFVALLGSLAIYTVIGTARTEESFPPIGQFVQVDGVRMHYNETGRGPPVVLIHGASTSLRDFDASIAGPLSRSHRVIAVDRPGHGYSERPPGDWIDPARQARLIRGLLARIGVHDPLLVGHSWSGSVVLAYLLDYPEEAVGGVLLAGGSHPWEGGVAWHVDLAGLPVLGEVFARTLAYPLGKLAIESAVEGVFAPNQVPEDYTGRTGILLSLRPETFLANAQDVRLLSDFLAGQSKRYGEISHPLLLVTGEKDTIVPAWNHAARLTRQIPGAVRVEFPDTGHALHHTHPARVVDLIETFSDQIWNPSDFADTAARPFNPTPAR
jgi:pimeloyl-ACP methyl ester carboxylesterase